jgi:hypothetical protein
MPDHRYSTLFQLYECNRVLINFPDPVILRIAKVFSSFSSCIKVKAHMTLMSTCPVCDSPGIGYSHKFAATLDTLMPAQCRTCGKYSIVVPDSNSWLRVPELVVGPVCFMVWLATGDLRCAVQLGLLGYAMVVSLVAKKSQLVAFVPQDELKLEGKRNRLLWALVGGLVLLLLLTALIPKALAGTL